MRCSLRRWALTVTTVFLITAAPCPAAATGDNVVIGYYFLSPEQINNYDDANPKIVPFPIANITAEKARQLTHINFAFLDVSADGECCWDAQVKPDKARDVIARLTSLRKHNPKLRILFSIGGWYFSNDLSPGVKHYRQAVATEAARVRFAKSCVKIMKDFDFDGIDIDWEYPRPEDAAPFVLALKEIRKLLTAENAGRGKRPYQLTIAGAGGAFFLSRYYAELPKIAEQFDYLNLMTYDLAGPWEATTNHHAALFGDPGGPKFYNALREARDDLPWEEKVKRHPSPFALTADAAVKQHLIAGVPPGKLVLGVPFYGRAFRGVAGDRGQYSGHSTPKEDPYVGDPAWLVGCPQAVADKEPRLVTYAQIKEMLAGDFGYVRYFNELTRTPWLFNARHKIFITYDDEQTIASKSKYIKEQKLAGAMFWHLGQDDSAGTLLKALHRTLNDATYDDKDVQLGKGIRYEGRGPLQLPVMEGPAWDATKIYKQGDKAAFEGFVWSARYYQSAGTRPSLQAGWDMIGRVKKE